VAYELDLQQTGTTDLEHGQTQTAQDDSNTRYYTEAMGASGHYRLDAPATSHLHRFGE
jgi:hypothetical protein